MIIRCYNENHPYILFLDIEFNNESLVQFSGLLFKNIDTETYQLMRSLNTYVSTKVCYPFMDYTSITNNFLDELGIPLADVISLIEDDFLLDIPYSDLLVVSHGLRNDRLMLMKNGINLLTHDDKPIDGYCTFTNARRILGRESHLTLGDMAEEAGYYIHSAHNAFMDTWAEVSVYTYLKKLEKQILDEKGAEE